MSETTIDDELSSSRLLPQVSEVTRPFWEGGRHGELLLEFCPSCERFTNPPLGRCPSCEGAVEHRAVSGRGRVFTYTVDHQPYNPAVPVPYVVALVELDEQAGLRVFTNLVGIAPSEVAIGLAVTVRFEDHDPVFVPVFVPA